DSLIVYLPGEPSSGAPATATSGAVVEIDWRPLSGPSTSNAKRPVPPSVRLESCRPAAGGGWRFVYVHVTGAAAPSVTRVSPVIVDVVVVLPPVADVQESAVSVQPAGTCSVKVHGSAPAAR